MAQTLRFRWFGIGRMPESVRPAPGGAAPLAFAEGVRSHLSIDGSAPGAGLAYGFRRSVSGACALWPERVVVSVGKTVVLDARAAEAAADGAGLVRMGPDGVEVEIDLGRAIPEGQGRFRVHVREVLGAELLASLPARELRVAIDPERARALLRNRKFL